MNYLIRKYAETPEKVLEEPLMRYCSKLNLNVCEITGIPIVTKNPNLLATHTTTLVSGESLDSDY